MLIETPSKGRMDGWLIFDYVCTEYVLMWKAL